jgi:hypothetical protein
LSERRKTTNAVEDLSVALPSVLSRSEWMVRNGMIYLGSSSPSRI